MSAKPQYIDENWHVTECTNAILFHLSVDGDDYKEDEIKAEYSVSYDLGKNYKNFCTELITDKNFRGYIKFEIITDGSCVINQNFTEDSDVYPINLDCTNVQTLTIKVESILNTVNPKEFVLNDAYLTNDGTAPTTQPTTAKPTTAPTTAKQTTVPVTIPETTVSTQPATLPTGGDATPDTPVETTAPVTTVPITTQETTSTETTVESSPTTTKATTSSSVVQTVASDATSATSTNAVSGISTSDTAGTQNSNDNNAVQTGAFSIGIILFLILASAAIGGYAIYRKKYNK